MTEDVEKLTAYLDSRTEHRLPRWEELPDLDLYMDQVESLVNRYLEYHTKEKMLTRSMVNNYVKFKVMPAPVKKKYNREHLAYLIVICLLKQVMPLSAVAEVIRLGTENDGVEGFYRKFCTINDRVVEASLAQARRSAEQGDSVLGLVLTVAMEAQAEMTLSEAIMEL